MPRWWWDNFSPISVCSAKSWFSKTCGIVGIFQNYKICEKFERHKGYFVLLKSLPKVLQKVLPKTWFLLFFKVEVFRAFFSSTTRKCLFYGDKMPLNAVKCHGMQLAYKDLKSLGVTSVPVQVRSAAPINKLGNLVKLRLPSFYFCLIFNASAPIALTCADWKEWQ
jgi:hypothetical protein